MTTIYALLLFKNFVKNKWKMKSQIVLEKRDSSKAVAQPAFTCSKLTVETLEQGMNGRLSGVLIDNFEHIPHLTLVFLLLTLNM